MERLARFSHCVLQTLQSRFAFQEDKEMELLQDLVSKTSLGRILTTAGYVFSERLICFLEFQSCCSSKLLDFNKYKTNSGSLLIVGAQTDSLPFIVGGGGRWSDVAVGTHANSLQPQGQLDEGGAPFKRTHNHLTTKSIPTTKINELSAGVRRCDYVLCTHTHVQNAGHLVLATSAGRFSRPLLLMHYSKISKLAFADACRRSASTPNAFIRPDRRAG